ncbi:MAG TPA: MEDS domain-containing protein [Egibacteraceae bacterium]|nr:MEDS domain-containing protein [Egibacteraceae bacterium]
MGIAERGIAAAPGVDRPGDHSCLVYDDAEQRAEHTAFWVRHGLDRGERVVYVQPPGMAGQFQDELASWGLDVTAPLREGRVVLLSPEQALLVDGDWDVARRMALHEAFVRESVGQGFAAVRMGADAAAAMAHVPGLAALSRYEKGMESLTLRLPVSVLCLYERRAFGQAFGGVALAHPRGMGDRQMHIVAKPGHVTLVGEVDMSNTQLVASALREAATLDGRLVVDLAGVSFIDLGGTTQLVDLARRLGGRDCVRVVGAPRPLRRILGAAGWTDELDLVGGGVG